MCVPPLGLFKERLMRFDVRLLYRVYICSFIQDLIVSLSLHLCGECF